jgi:hypothetical protein
MQTKHATDFLAVIMIGGMAGSYARFPTKDKAVKEVVRIYRLDFGSAFKLPKHGTVTVNVVEVTGHKTISWDNSGFYIGNDMENRLDRPVERVEYAY